jgi:hypothetical protein
MVPDCTTSRAEAREGTWPRNQTSPKVQFGSYMTSLCLSSHHYLCEANVGQGRPSNHGLAVHVTQEKRRCLLLGTIYGHTDEEALWHALMWWACLQPGNKQPRQTPGQLSYPAEQSRVFEKYWNHLENLEEHPVFCHGSEFAQGCMKHFSSAISKLDLADFTPRVSAEAKDKDAHIAEEAAISRLRQIQDSSDMWALHRSSAGTV